jgi:putative ABC transport system permease protein
MPLSSLIRASLTHYRGLNALVIGGIAVAVAVLTGALLVGGSVRDSLRNLALARLGATELVVSSTGYFRADLAGQITGGPIADAVPIIALAGTVTHEDSRRTAARIQVFGIDERFVAFHGLDTQTLGAREAWISQAVAAELDARPDDSILLRLAKPTDIPLSHLQGRRDEASQRVRLSVARVLDRAALGEFSLIPAQGPALTVFVPLARLQQDLGVGARANALLTRLQTPDATAEEAVGAVRAAVSNAARLDDLGLTLRTDAAGTAILESRSGLLPDAVWQPAQAAAARSGHEAVGALTYLANTIRAGDREIPYSLIAAVNLEAYDRLTSTSTSSDAAGPAHANGDAGDTDHPPIRLNQWAAADLGVVPGARVDVEYFLWSDEQGLQTRSTPFTFVGTVPMAGAGGDPTLTPEYPGITDAGSVTSWDPPFPVDMRRVRPRDEDYWDQWRAAPKAFVPLDVGQQLWGSRFGSLSSLRAAAGPEWPPMATLDVFAAGFTVRHARAEALAAAEGTTDFGEYFVYFSFFIVVSGLLLAGLFFALSVEQRAKELGLLVATGFTGRDLRRMLMAEAVVLALAGSVLGVLGAVGYAALIMHGLRTWWVGAVGTTALTLHVDPLLLVAGAAGALVATVVALALSLRRLATRSARALLTAGLTSVESSLPGTPSGRSRRALARPVAVVTLATALVLVMVAAAGWMPQVAAFFAAGGLLLIAGCAALAVWLARPGATSDTRTTVIGFGAAYARWRPARSVLSAALIAFACFVIVAVGAFRRDDAGASLAREAGTGGFMLMAESVAPLMHNPNTPSGRDDLSLAGYDELDQATISRWRLRPGDDASCLTLYQPTNPRIVAPEQAFLDEGRFTFASSLAETPAERENPWRLLTRRFADGAVPAIADQTSLTYVFHLRVGDDFVFTPDGLEPVRLRIVGALADSVLQSELIIGEQDFVRLFPHHEGYRVWMIEAPEADAPAITTIIEDRLSDFGVDVIDTRARLAAYHQVENTYLATFQALGALGLLLGTLGLAAVLARNVLERRRELGLLGAIGFTPRHLRTMVTAESLLLVLSGVAIGTIAALVAIAPALADRTSAPPVGSLALLLAAVAATGLIASSAAVGIAARVRVVEALKNE